MLRVAKAAKHFGVSAGTVRRWCNTGRLQSYRTPGGQRVIDISPTDVPKPTNPSTIILYSRVSSTKQRDDLQRQQQYLRDNHKGQPEAEIVEVSDVASGLNFKRPGLLKVLGRIQEGGVRLLVVASKDRLARFGFDLIEWLCREYNTEIMVLDNTNSTPTEELGKDLLSIIQIYCCKWNGSRRYKTQKNKQDIEIETISESKTEEDIK